MIRVLLLVAILAGVATATLDLLRRGPPVPPPAPPPAEIDTGPSPRDRERGRHLGALREAHSAVTADPTILAAMGLELDPYPDRAFETWLAARARYVELTASPDLAFAVWRLTRAPPTPEVATLASELLLVERLLDRAHQREEPPLFPAGKGPGLARLLRTCVATRFHPAWFRREGEGAEEVRHRVWGELVAGGREFQVLRDLEDSRIPEGPGIGFNSRFRLQNFLGTAHADPALTVPGVIDIGVYSDRDRIRTERATRRLDVAIPAPQGDLVLVMNLWRLFRVGHARIEVVGAEQDATFLVSREDAEPWGAGPAHSRSHGYAVRLRASALPAGARRLRMVLVGLQPIGNSEPNANLHEVWMLTKGPLPPPLAEHAWDAGAPDEATLDAVQAARLTGKVAAAERRIARAPDEPEGYLQLARAYREFGRLEDAQAAAEAARERDPDEAAARLLLGEVAWDRGEEREAVEHWLAALDRDPAGRARELLERHAPGEFDGIHWIEFADTFREVCAFEASFRRLEDVVQAAALLAGRTGRELAFTAGSWRGDLRVLEEAGALAVPADPLEGAFLRGPDGTLRSSVHGTRAAPARPLAPLVAPRGYRVLPSQAWRALARGGAAELEVAFPILPAGAFLEDPGTIAGLIGRVDDPRALALAAARIHREVRPDTRGKLRVLVPSLQAALGRVGGPAGWRIRALLDALGVTDLPPLPEPELDDLLEAVDQGRVPREAPRSAFRAMGRAATRAYLLRALASPRLGVVAVAAEAFPYFAEEPDGAALRAARSGPHGAVLARVLGRAHQRLTGKSLPEPDS